MQAIVRRLATPLLILLFPVVAIGADASHCAATLSGEEQRHLEACVARGKQCTDFWPGYPDDLADCTRTQKWLARAIAMPETLRQEIFGPMPASRSASEDKADPPPASATTTAGGTAAQPPAWKNLPRNQGSAPRDVASGVNGANASDYSGASSQLDPEQARAAGLRFWTGQAVLIGDTVALSRSEPQSAPRPVSPPAAPAPLPGGTQGMDGGSPAGSKRELPVTYTNHPNATNQCVELRGNTIGNRCNFDLLITWCVSQPQQTKNFFDNSGAFECGKGGGLNTIKAGSTEGNVLYGYINYYACPYTDYYTPARMKTQFSAEGLGLYRGTCGDGDKLSNHWTVGGTLVSRPRQ